MSSSATADGVLNLTVTFEIGTNVDLAQVQVQNRVGQALARLPGGGACARRRRPRSVRPTSRWSCTSCRPTAATTRSISATTRCSTCENELARLPGAGQVHRLRRRRLRDARLARPEQSRRARTLGGRRRAGDPRAEPAGRGRRRRRTADAGPGRVSAHGDREGPAHRRERVRQHHREDGRERRGHATARRRAHRAQRRRLSVCAHCSTTSRPSPSACSRRRARTRSRCPAAVRATMAELKTRFPQGVDWSAVYDPTVFVRDSIHEVIRTLLEATLMVVIVVVLFLQTWRASVIPLAAVPISIVGTFAVMLASGLLDQHAVAVRHGAGDRHRRRRRDRRRRERRAAHRGRTRRRARRVIARWRK